MAELNVDRFMERLGKIHSHFSKHRSTAAWSNASCLSLCRGPLDDSNTYLKSVILHQYLFGYELPDLILLLTLTGDLHVMGSKKKMDFLEAASEQMDGRLHLHPRNKADDNAANWEALRMVLQENNNGHADSTHTHTTTNTTTDKPIVVGSLIKEQSTNAGINDDDDDTATTTTATTTLVGQWETNHLKNIAQGIELVDCAPGLSYVMALKDDSELDLMKKSSVLSNKLMKHGCIPKVEDIINESTQISHETLAQLLDDMIEDPSQINLKIPKDDVASCYFPIVQSGGIYDCKVSAISDTKALQYDIILISLGARYKNYCSHMARTFLVDPPKAVSDRYETLLGMQEYCLKAMRPGKPLKNVYKAAVLYLQNHNNGDGNDNVNLVSHLPKNLGFGMGLDFRDANMTLSAKNSAIFKPGMTFTLICAFQNLELTPQQRASTPKESSVKTLETYGLQIADMVSIQETGSEVMTKLHKQLTDISYTINDDDDDDDDDDNDNDEDAGDDNMEAKEGTTKGDAALARRLAKERDDQDGPRQSSRLAKHADAAQDVEEGAAVRERKQVTMMKRRNEERLQELARANAKNSGKGGENDEPEELDTYRRTRDYPDNVQPNQVKVDMANQCVILPICGNPVPFHISTIKNVVLPDPDNATYLRINFYTAGMAVGKDAPVNTAKLVAKYAPHATFIRELTFRSLDSHNLTQAFRQISELRKRARTRELRQQEEANLVEQEKLVRTKNERVPRLSDLTMRPVVAGRKTQGNLEAHSNGLRFISTRSEVVDIMYANIKYAIFQPCESEIMVLVHFHLNNSIMVGKKRQKDVQFFTEVVDASQTVDAGRRSMYDPDEMDDEQRERQLRKKLNAAFRDFCKKVDAVAKKNNFSLEFDLPYRDLGFTGNPHKEMVFIQPTLNCLVNLTETPFFVVDLADVDHVHFERVTYMSKAFDIVLVNKDFSKAVWRIDMIANSDKDAIQDWLTDMELTYTQGPMNLNWKQIMQTVNVDDRFYMETEEDEVTEKEAGWEFLRMYGHDDDDGDDDDEDDSGYSEAPEEEGSEEEAASEEEEEEFDSEEEDESDFDADEELEEQGMDWADMEKEALREDKQRVRRPEDEDPRPAKKRRGSSQQPQQRRGSSQQRRTGSGQQQRRAGGSSQGQQRRAGGSSQQRRR